MSTYGSVRHPVYSIGEGVFSEKEERLRKQGLNKKNIKSPQLNTPPPTNLSVDKIWKPNKILNFNVMTSGLEKMSPKSLKGKI